MYLTRLEQHMKINRCEFSNNSLFFIRQSVNEKEKEIVRKVRRERKKRE